MKPQILLLLLLTWAPLSSLSLSSSSHAASSRNATGAPHRLKRAIASNAAGEPLLLTCGYPSCPGVQANKINVHIVAHTHDDVGWLKTADQYYYGTKKRFSPVGVQFILDSLVPQLLMDKSKRFVYVEISFFSKWWLEQDESMRASVRNLVQEGRLEFINGGWCMNDEATVSYSSTIEQMTLGLRFLNQTFGPCALPKVGWQIDPFGHSNEQASLFAQFGFDGMFFTRESYQSKRSRINDKSLDLVWHGDRALAAQTGSIFTSIFRDFYDTPPGFCFDVMCLDDNLVDNKNSLEYNIEEKGAKFIEYIRSYASSRLTSNILVPMGGDFHFSAANYNFKNLDKLMRYVRKASPDINIFYSSPSCYQLAIHDEVEEGNLRLPEKFHDFMPYESSSAVWWSGYFASRPSVKLIERQLSVLLSVSRMISLANILKPQNYKRWPEEVADHESRCLLPLWEMLSDLQHHDAVTGTEKQHVYDDYIRRSSAVMDMCARFIGEFRRQKISDYVRRSGRYEQLRDSGRKFRLDPIFLGETTVCEGLNISQCNAFEANNNFFNRPEQERSNGSSSPGARNKRLVAELPPELETRAVLLNVYNPSVNPIVQHDIRLPCNGGCDLDKVRVFHLTSNDTMKLIRLPLPSGVGTLPFRNAIANYEFLFYANVPPLGHTSFVIEDLNNEEIVDEENESTETQIIGEDSVDSNKHSRILGRRKRDSGAEGGANRYEYFTMGLSEAEAEQMFQPRTKRETTSSRAQPRDLLPPVVFHQPAVQQHPQQQNQQQVHQPSHSQPHQSFNQHQQPVEHQPPLQHHQQEPPPPPLQQQRPQEPTPQQQQQQQQVPPVSSQPHKPQTERPASQVTDRVVVKFDMDTGMIVGLRRVGDRNFLNITQKFGYYFPNPRDASPPGAYTFKVNTSEPVILDKPMVYKMFKRKNGALIEIHQKWTDWIWQTIRVDARKNYIEFDYVVGPVPAESGITGREVITRYLSSLPNKGVFFTDSNARQLMPRHRLRVTEPEHLGGSFYPVASSMLLMNLADPNSANRPSTQSVAILVDRTQAGTSLREGQLELLIHRRIMSDDNLGVGEPLNEPGEDGRGLVSRGKHRLFIRFRPLPEQQAPQTGGGGGGGEQTRSRAPQRSIKIFKLAKTPRANLSHETSFHESPDSDNPFIQRPTASYLVNDPILDDIRVDTKKLQLDPVLTFDRLRVSARELVEMVALNPTSKSKNDLNLMNVSLPENVHLLTLQPWPENPNEILIRIENLDNPLIIHPFPDYPSYQNLVRAYLLSSEARDSVIEYAREGCHEPSRPSVEVDLEYFIRRIRIVSLEELRLGANIKLSDDKRLDWTGEQAPNNCDRGLKPTTVRLYPRQIRTFLARFDYI